MGIIPDADGLCMKCRKHPYVTLAEHWYCGHCAFPYLERQIAELQRDYRESKVHTLRLEAGMLRLALCRVACELEDQKPAEARAICEAALEYEEGSPT